MHIQYFHRDCIIALYFSDLNDYFLILDILHYSHSMLLFQNLVYYQPKLTINGALNS